LTLSVRSAEGFSSNVGRAFPDERLKETLHAMSATLAEDLYQIRVVPRHDRAVLSSFVVELPIVQGDKEARAAFATQFAQALTSRKVQETLETIAPNNATQTEFGTVTIIKADYWNELSHHRIAEDASTEYAPRLGALLTTPSCPTRLQQIQAVPTFAKSDAKAVDDLVAAVRDSKGVKPEEFVTQCLKEPEVYTGGTVSVSLAQADSFVLNGDMLAILQKPAFTENESKHKLETIRTTLAGLNNEITARAPEIQKLDQKIQHATRALEKALSLHYPQSLMNKAAAFLANPQKKLVALKNSITKCRESVRRKLQLTSEVDLLSGAITRLRDILEDQERRLQGALNLLKPFLRPEVANGSRMTECVPFDDVLPTLLTFAEQSKSNEEILRLLAACVAKVTLSGLAAIVGASEPQPASIAQRLFGTEPTVLGPRWGGRKPRTAGIPIIVLPPVDEAVLNAIRTYAPMMDGNTVVAAAETAEAGANVVKLEVHCPRDISELITTFLGAALKDAAAQPELHADEKDDYLNWATSRMNGARIAA
jgi:hypothetical protein